MIQLITPKISEIKKMPTMLDNVHETVYKAHATLMLIIEMVNRGDSKETIWNVYDELYNSHIESPNPVTTSITVTSTTDASEKKTLLMDDAGEEKTKKRTFSNV